MSEKKNSLSLIISGSAFFLICMFLTIFLFFQKNSAYSCWKLVKTDEERNKNSYIVLLNLKDDNKYMLKNYTWGGEKSEGDYKIENDKITLTMPNGETATAYYKVVHDMDGLKLVLDFNNNNNDKSSQFYSKKLIFKQYFPKSGELEREVSTVNKF